MCVQVLSIGLLDFEKLLLVSEALAILLKLYLQGFLLLVEHLLTFMQNIVVEGKLLLIKLVDSFHVFHALFQDLHLSLKFNLLLSLLVRVLAHHILQILGVLTLLLLSLGQVDALSLLVLGE